MTSTNDQVGAYAGLVKEMAEKMAAGEWAKRVGAEVADLAQEGLISVWQALEDGKTPSAEVIRLRMLMYVRKLARQLGYTPEEEGEAPWEPPVSLTDEMDAGA